MAPLVSLADVWTHLEVEEGTDGPRLQKLIAGYTAEINRACDRSEAPFCDAIDSRTEVREGVTGYRLFLDYPIDTITSIKIGRSFASPDVELNPADPEQVTFDVGRNELVRTDGNYWDQSLDTLLSWSRGGPLNGDPTRRGPPPRVQIIYKTKDFRPAEVQQAVILAVAAAYNQQGSDGVKSESLGNYSYTMASLSDGSPLGTAWQGAIALHRRLAFL